MVVVNIIGRNNTADLTLTDHAEAWYKEQGNTIPQRYSEGWWAMYENWIEYAFEEIVGDYEPTEDSLESFEEAWYE